VCLRNRRALGSGQNRADECGGWDSSSDKADGPTQNESVTEVNMRISSYLLVLALLALVGCVGEPSTVTTTTTTQEVTTAPAREVVVTRAPPPLRVETQTVAPGQGYVWMGGYWRWTGTDYVWVPGTWVVRPRPAAVWVAGHWVRRPGGWVWFPGHWQ
jgi:WXXGXW repeat (2 copies)